MRIGHSNFVWLFVAMGLFAFGPLSFAQETGVPLGSVIVTDGIDSYDDLSMGKDIDPPDDRELVIRWNFDFPDAKDYHVYVLVDGETQAKFLGRPGGDGLIQNMRWKKGTPLLGAPFLDGPQSGHSYQFIVFAMRESFGLSFVSGPFQTKGPVQYLVVFCSS